MLAAYEFEQHAGAKTRHPNNHIYLENGKPIYNIIQELKTAPFSILDEVIKDVAGKSINEESFQDWKGNNLCFTALSRFILVEHSPISSIVLILFEIVNRFIIPFFF